MPMPHNTAVKTEKSFFPIYLSSFLFAFHIALPLYINSSFLGKFLSETAIGVVYTVSSIVTIGALIALPKLLSRLGNYKTTVGILLSQAVLLLFLAMPLSPAILLTVFILTQTLIVLGMFSIDVFMEYFSADKTTGFTRGTLLTVINIAILLGPLTTGIILSNGNFSKIYIIAALFLVPTIFVIMRNFRTFKDPQYQVVPYIKTTSAILFARHPNDEIRHAVLASLLLRFFFTWMVVYTPLYLSAYIGFDWKEIGIMFAIMLLPFVLFELPAGKLSDTRVGEKNIMFAGFFIMSLFTASLFFIEEPSFAIWAALLFGTRIGASLVEITSESYFFKHIRTEDTEVLSIFRNTQPIATIVAPLLASLVLLVLDMKYLFLVLAIIMLSGLWVAAGMRPTRLTQTAKSML